MKSLTISFIIVLICAQQIFAQDNTSQQIRQQPETLFGNEPIRSGGYGGPELKLMNIKGDLGLAVGGRGGWIINNMFSIGGGGYGIVTRHTLYTEPLNTERYDVMNGYGGVFLEYINSSNRVIHLTINTLIGGGNVSINKKYINNSNYSDFNNVVNESYFIIEPGITADVNVTRYFRIGVGASYKFVSSVNLRLLSNNGTNVSNIKTEDINGASFNLIFKFGSF